MTWPPRLTLRRVVTGVALVALVTVALAWALILRTTDPEPHRAVLDGLGIPASWERTHEEIVQDILLGSRVERYYLVDADPADVVAPAQSFLVAAGFRIEVQHVASDWCDRLPRDVAPKLVCPEKPIPACSTNGPGGPTTCYFYANRGQECVAITALDRGEAATYFQGTHSYRISDPVRIVVRLIDYYPGPFPCRPPQT